MEENSAAVECLILFYINTKQVLKTKQLDERVFLDQMIRYCKSNGFDTYSDEEIRSTWKNLTLKYVELKKTGTTEEKESWKYYEIFDSCYEQSDFHNGVYPKFSEEMVWFLIECFLKRKGLEKTQKKNGMLHEIHNDFLQSGYLYITKQDIENKWKYLNLKYDKLKDDANSFNKFPYLQALRGFREKGKGLVKIIFTKELTEILIERFTEKKITCVIHGYDSEQVLSEIQSEFRDLGFYFSQEEIKDKWKKLTNVYTFLKTKGKHDSSWTYFNAMKEHFKDDFLFELGQIESGVKDDNKPKLPKRQRSKSVGADARLKYNGEMGRTKLVVNIEQLNKEELPHSSPEKLPEGKNKRITKRKPSPKVTGERSGDHLHTSPKKLKVRSKSREKSRTNKNKRTEVNGKKIRSRSSGSLTQTVNSLPVKKNKQLTKFPIDRNGNQERRGSMDIGSPGSKVHIINIDESKIDKKSGNLTINLPSITKQFSDNEFLPLKKRQRMGDGNADRHSDEPKEIKDGFRGFPREETEGRKRLKSNDSENKRLTEEEMTEIMEKINRDTYNRFGIDGNNTYTENQNYCKPEEFSYNYQGSYGNFNQPCLLIPKEEQQENLSLQNYSPNAITPPPVLLLVIKVDGSNPAKESPVPEDKKQAENKLNESPEKNERSRMNNSSKITQKSDGCPAGLVKSVSPKNKSCTVTQNKHISGEAKNSEADDLQSKIPNIDLNKNTSPKNKKWTIIQNENAVKIESTEVKSSETNIEVKVNSLVKLNGAKQVIPPAAQSDDKEVAVQNPEVKNTQQTDIQNKDGEVANADVVVAVHMPSPEKANVKSDTSGTVTLTPPKNIMMPPTPQPTNTPKKIRLPVKGGGKVKEIFISPRELSKLTTARNAGFKTNISPTKPTNESLVNTKLEVNPYKPPPKFKFISQVIRPPKVEISADNKSEKVVQSEDSKVTTFAELSSDVNCTLPHSTTVLTGTKFLGTNASATSSRNLKNEEFENESVFSEAVGDDDCLKDNLLATVIDFQEQNNQEFVEIKNLMKQNNLLQRETNRLLRLMLEKM